MLNSVEGTGNILKTGQVSMGYALVLSQRTLLRNLYPKPIGVLVHCREEKPTIGSPYFGASPSDCIP
jgi:hypothetical protein